MDDVDGVLRAVLDELVGYTADRISVHLVGPRGSGRTEALRLAADRLEDAGSTVLRLHGNPAWRHEPYSALSAGIRPASASGPRRSAGEMVAAVVQHPRGRVVMVCDDADVDPLSVGVLLAAHWPRRLVAITSSRPDHPVDPESLTLGLTRAVRVKAPVLGMEQVHDLVRGLLGGPVDAGTLARITMRFRGEPPALALRARNALTDDLRARPPGLVISTRAAAGGTSTQILHRPSLTMASASLDRTPGAVLRRQAILARIDQQFQVTTVSMGCRPVDAALDRRSQFW